MLSQKRWELKVPGARTPPPNQIPGFEFCFFSLREAALVEGALDWESELLDFDPLCATAKLGEMKKSFLLSGPISSPEMNSVCPCFCREGPRNGCLSDACEP